MKRDGEKPDAEKVELRRRMLWKITEKRKRKERRI